MASPGLKDERACWGEDLRVVRFNGVVQNEDEVEDDFLSDKDDIFFISPGLMPPALALDQSEAQPVIKTVSPRIIKTEMKARHKQASAQVNSNKAPVKRPAESAAKPRPKAPAKRNQVEAVAEEQSYQEALLREGDSDEKA